MAYTAKLIPLTCDEQAVRTWAAFILAHSCDVALGLWREGTRREFWYLGREGAALYAIGVMDVVEPPPAIASEPTPPSWPAILRTHREFKAHWDRERVYNLPIDPDVAPDFPDCELLLDLRAAPSATAAPGVASDGTGVQARSTG